MLSACSNLVEKSFCRQLICGVWYQFNMMYKYIMCVVMCKNS